MDPDGRNQKQLKDDAFSERNLSVTPGGRHIIFASVRSGTAQSLWQICDVNAGKQVTGCTPKRLQPV
jgi:hypothetical protein